jgi:glycogen debranching enzyme
MPTLTTTNPTVARAWRTACEDLASLALGAAEGPAAPIAGLPLYLQFFGRATLTIGWQALLATPTPLRDALRVNAALQGTRIDDWMDEEPGKLIHQAGRGPLAILGHNPFSRYYGDYATAPDFLIMVGQYLTWTNDVATVRALLPAARKAIEWIERYGDLDGDGFLEYVCRSPKGVKNQGWKDSDDAIVDEEGNVVENPSATCEIQAYWYVGLQQVALVFLRTGDVGYALGLLRKARDLKARFNAAFWMEDEGFYALALGPDKRQVRSIASNAGHLLAAGIVPHDRAKRVARRLMREDLFSGWGIRTLSSEHPAYNPFSYHLGSVWPVENGTFALGLARYGLWEELHRLAEGIFAATDSFAANRLPEALGGQPRDAAHPFPAIYPRSCEPHGWSASMIVIVVQALLRLYPLAPLGLLLVDPHLPPWLPDLRLDGVRVGPARVDLAFERQADGETRFRVTGRDGTVRVLRQPPPDAPEATILGRLSAALRPTLGR